MFTRFSDDDARVQKKLDGLCFAAKYQLEAPGNGLKLPYFQDPNVRLQRFGANLRTNTVGVESDLFGMTRKYCRDEVNANDYTKHEEQSHPYTLVYEEETPFVCESRAILPAWNLRGVEVSRWERPFLNPQANLEKRFQDNISTRLMEKDFFVREV